MDQIFILHFEDHKNETSSTAWFWARSEAESQYDQTMESLGEDQTITMYSADARGVITDFVDEALGNGAEGLDEIRSSRKAEDPKEATWTELVFRPDGSFTFERLLSPDYWPYVIEPYAGELSQGTQSWRVLDATTATPIAIIRPKGVGTNTAFTVVVNGYSQTQAFNDLKSAAIYAAKEYNGV